MICASCGLDVAWGGREEVEARCERCGGQVVLAGRYLLERVLGEGSAGLTYLATEVGSRREVAIKELSMKRLQSFKKQELFEREAQVLAQLDHPGVPTYYEDFVWGVGKHQAFYLVEEYIEGGTLREQMATRRYSEGEVLAMLESALEVLVYLHERVPMVVHRDIKPENLMWRMVSGAFDEASGVGQVVLVDFGVVRDGPVLGGTLVGTPGYMAPEQARGEAYPESDVFALGVVASEMLARQRRTGESWRKALKRVGVSRGVYVGLKQMMRVRHDERWTAGEALEWVRRVQQGEALVKPGSSGSQVSGDLMVLPGGIEGGEQRGAMVVRRESLFGMWSAMGAVVVMGMPCLTIFVGFMNALIVLSVVCLLMIVMVPFMRFEEEEDA